MVWLSTEPHTPKGRILDLQCNGKEFRIYTHAPSQEELHAWLTWEEAIYALMIRGCHTLDEGVSEEEAYRIYRLKWTEPTLATWCYHSATSIKKTFENTTQHYKSIAYENQLFPTHSFKRRFSALRVKWLEEDVCTDSFKFKAPWAQGRIDTVACYCILNSSLLTVVATSDDNRWYVIK